MAKRSTVAPERCLLMVGGMSAGSYRRQSYDRPCLIARLAVFVVIRDHGLGLLGKDLGVSAQQIGQVPLKSLRRVQRLIFCRRMPLMRGVGSSRYCVRPTRSFSSA